MGSILSTFMSEGEIRQLAIEVLLPKIRLLKQQQFRPESSPSTTPSDVCLNPESPPDEVVNPPEAKKGDPNNVQDNAEARTMIQEEPKGKNPRSVPSPILCEKQLSPSPCNTTDSNNNPRSSSIIVEESGEKTGIRGSERISSLKPNVTATKTLINSKSKSKKLPLKSSRELLTENLKGDGITFKRNTHEVEITATFKIRPDYTATFNYSYNPSTKTEVFKTNCGKDKLVKLEIPLDKYGNADATQFLKSLTKLSSKHEGKIVLNGYTISMDNDPSRRLKIVSLDVKSSPMILQLSSKGIKGVRAIRSQTKLEVHGETEFGGDNDKRIKIEGDHAMNIRLYSPEGKGKLFVCIPTLDQNANAVDPAETAKIAGITKNAPITVTATRVPISASSRGKR